MDNKNIIKQWEKDFDNLKIGRQLLNGYTIYRNEDRDNLKIFIKKIIKKLKS